MTQAQALASLSLVRVGQHSSVSSVYTAPGSLVFVEPDLDPTVEHTYEPQERSPLRGDGRMTPPRNGRKAGSASLTMRLRGLSRENMTDASTPTSTQQELSPFLSMLMGAEGTANTGSALGVGSSGDSLVLSSGAGVAVGSAILVADGGDDGKLVARHVVSKATNTLTLDRALDGTPSGSVAASASWAMAYSNTEHKHVFIDYETEADRVRLFGCLGSGSLDFGEDGAQSKLSVQLAATSWDTPAKAEPTFSAPATGAEILSLDAVVWVGGQKYTALKGSLDFGLEVVEQKALTSPNGLAGRRVTKKAPKLSLQLYFDADLLETLQGDASTHDVAVQLGRELGACVYIRMPAASCQAKRSIVQGQFALDIVATACRSSEASDLFVHLF